MSDLTDKWKAKKLRQGTYYIKIADVVFIDFFNAKTLKFTRFKEKYIEEVLALVPSYQELQRLESDSLAKNEGVEIVAELEQKIHILTESQMKLENTVGELGEQSTGLKDKNGKLIYEGDIVRVYGKYQDLDLDKEIEVDYIDVVESLEKFFSEAMSKIIYNALGCDTLSVKVIGNIHENHELLEKKDD